MTIHAAKGLEGKIVFLPDVCSTPTSRLDFPIFLLDTEVGPLPVWSPRKELDCSGVAALRAEKKEAGLQEYRRLLYVAMTRAEERLYIAGHRGKTEVAPESWRIMLEQALGANASAAPAPWGKGESVLRFGETSTEAPVVRADAASQAPRDACPAWLTSPVRSPQA